MESEVPLHLPTSGQILAVLVKSMGLSDDRLRSKTAQRYFSGLQGNLVKESSRSEVIEAISDALGELGLQAPLRSGGVTSTSLQVTAIKWHAVQWDRLRAFLLPRMPRVYPSHAPMVWQAYVRLAAIDLALRAAAQLHLTGASQDTLAFLNWISVSRRGVYLNEKRRNADITFMSFAESVGVHENAVEGWLYKGARPSDENLVKIGGALASNDDPSECERIVHELRRLYWISEVALVLGEYVGSGVVEDIVGRLHRYALLAYHTIGDRTEAEAHPEAVAELAARGAQAPLAQALLTVLVSRESDPEWKEDLLAAGSDWKPRVLRVNLRVHQSEEDSLIRETDGQILKDWSVANPKAYEHYRRSTELQMQGRAGEALAEVVKAIELDPLDPANHFTLGSVKGAIGAGNGDEALVREGLEACWIAVALDPNWILPWTEIGWILIRTGRGSEAVEHLRAVSPDCGPLDSRYYAALGLAQRELGDFRDSLAAFELSLELNPNDMSVATAAAGVALLAGDRLRSNRYRKIARHLGASAELDRVLEFAELRRKGD